MYGIHSSNFGFDVSTIAKHTYAWCVCMHVITISYIMQCMGIDACCDQLICLHEWDGRVGNNYLFLCFI